MRQVSGIDVDVETRCVHWNSPRDIVAIKMKCCGVYYACKDCHEALADHAIEVWPRSDWAEKAILCGACGGELSIDDYLACESDCPCCGARFNPLCRNHYGSYFGDQE
jgi:uncharacterized CHY-type Zn-finger protein